MKNTCSHENFGGEELIFMLKKCFSLIESKYEVKIKKKKIKDLNII